MNGWTASDICYIFFDDCLFFYSHVCGGQIFVIHYILILGDLLLSRFIHPAVSILVSVTITSASLGHYTGRGRVRDYQQCPTWEHLDTVIPIAKPGKDTSDPTSYRPIALTSCPCKVMERMINTRLVWYLEKLKLITPVQSGFRKLVSNLRPIYNLITTQKEHESHLIANEN